MPYNKISISKTSSSIILFLLSCFSAPGIWADESPFFFGIDAGTTDIENTAGDATNVGLVVGYAVKNGFGFEVQYTSSISDGEIGSGQNKVDFDAKTLTAYTAYRHDLWKNLYGKIKLGVARAEVNSVGDTNGSFGLGLGYRFKYGLIELEASRLTKDFNFYNLGYKYTF